jgi:hypothetical protein
VQEWADSLREPVPSHPDAARDHIRERIDNVAQRLEQRTHEEENEWRKMQQGTKDSQRHWLRDYEYSENAFVREEREDQPFMIMNQFIL